MTLVVRRRGSSAGDVVGLDLSLTGTGVANADGTLETLKPSAEHTSGPARMAWIRDEVLQRCAGAQLVTIERLVYNATVTKQGKEPGDAPKQVNSPSASELAGLYHVVAVALWEARRRVLLVTQGQVKILATGKGNVGKLEVFKATLRLLGLDPKDDNQSDAAWVRVYGKMALGHADVPTLPKAHTRALDSIDWSAF